MDFTEDFQWNFEDMLWLRNGAACRGCLDSPDHQQLSSTCLADDGTEVCYQDMFRNCFGITLSCIPEWDDKLLLCADCSHSLQDAHRFLRQVERAEAKISTHTRDVLEETVIKTEVSDEVYLDSIHREEPYVHEFNEKSRDLRHKPNVTKSTLSEVKTKAIKRKRAKKLMSDDETDIISYKEQEVENNCELICNENLLNTDYTEDTIIDFSEPIKANYQITKKPIKQVSARKRIRLTCDAVLKNTTALPFRHKKSWFQCFYCHEVLMSMDLLKKHTDTHTQNDRINIKYPTSLQIDIKEFKCKICDTELNNVEFMVKHFFETHKTLVYKECIADYKINTSPFICHICNKEYHVFRTLTTHLNEHNANCICDVCGKSFTNSKRLKVHKRTHEIGEFPCSICGKILKTQTSKSNHMQTAHSKRILKCHICLKPMKHYNDRIKHMSEVHNITHSFKCSICFKEYNIKHYLATHMRQTHGHKNKKCLDCGMAFITNHSLKKHMLKHTGVKSFVCEVCNKTYARGYTLKEHMKVHDTAKFVVQ